MIKVKQIVKRLLELDQEAFVVQSKDSEGNSFSPVASIDTALYEPETPWRGDLVEVATPKSQKAVVFWPTN